MLTQPLCKSTLNLANRTPRQNFFLVCSWYCAELNSWCLILREQRLGSFQITNTKLLAYKVGWFEDLIFSVIYCVKTNGNDTCEWTIVLGDLIVIVMSRYVQVGWMWKLWDRLFSTTKLRIWWRISAHTQLKRTTSNRCYSDQKLNCS